MNVLPAMSSEIIAYPIRGRIQNTSFKTYKTHARFQLDTAERETEKGWIPIHDKVNITYWVPFFLFQQQQSSHLKLTSFTGSSQWLSE